MPFESSNIRLGHAAAHHKRHGSMKKQILQVRDSSCTGTGALYVKPALGAVIDSAADTTIQWNPDCLAPAGGDIDIYLYAPQNPTANLPIHAWTNVPAKTGAFDVKLAPVWWNVVPNTTSSVELSLNIVPTGNQPWDTANPFGPTWNATYTAPAPGQSPPADAVASTAGDLNKLISIFYKGGHITSGGEAAAIICPLIVLFVAIGIFVRKMHINRNNKTADWAEHMDKRMSQISLDWQAGGDGSAGPIPGSRPASFMGRPQSSYRPSLDHVRALYNANLANASTSQTNLAGMGTANADQSEFDHEMSEAQGHARSITDQSAIRQSQYRASRISFAPSTELGTTHPSARGHNKNSASLPRVGVNGGYRGSSGRDSQFTMPKIDPRFKTESQLRNTENFDEDDDEFMMSPTQEAGAKPLDFGNVRRSIDEDVRNSMLRYPALEMVTQNGSESNLARPVSGMSIGADSAYAPDAMVSDVDNEVMMNGPSTSVRSQSPQDYLQPRMQTGMLPPSNAASPDEALRQYAAQRAAGSSPMPSNTMRTLYSTEQPRTVSPVTGNHRAAHSIETSTINEDDVVGYNEMIDHSKQ